MHIIDRYKVQTFVEIGVDQGGLASLMLGRVFIVPDFYYHGVELLRRVINEDVWIAATRSPKSSIIIGDSMSQEVTNRIANAIRASRRTLLLCDGGDKPKEVNHYCNLLAGGDLLVVHDYGKEFNEGDIPSFVDTNFERINDYMDVGLPLWQRL
jgi:hypothetical protein